MQKQGQRSMDVLIAIKAMNGCEGQRGGCQLSEFKHINCVDKKHKHC